MVSAGNSTRAAISFPVVAFAGGRGSLEALTEILQLLPPDSGLGMIYYNSENPLDAKATALEIEKQTSRKSVVASRGKPLEADRVYVVPNDSVVTISRGQISVQKSPSVSGNGKVDHFFNALCSSLQRRAIGVLLSGHSPEGVKGLQCVKDEDGILFVQSMESSLAPAMPASAITRGIADFVLSPKQIAAELVTVSSHFEVYYDSQKFEEGSASLNFDQLKPLLQLIQKLYGVDFRDYKPATVLRRLSRRMMLRGFQKLEDYLDFLSLNANELETLYDEILIHVTSFFRDKETFDALKSEILPKLIKKSAPAIRVWVPGCSTGEEGYSIAIVLQEYLKENAITARVQIFATDVSEKAITQARAGLYPASITEDVSSDRLQRFFRKTEKGYEILKGIRDLCVFSKHNILKDAPFSRIDLISCRNVLIYLGQKLQKRAFSVFHYSLNPEGFLILGTAESVGAFSDYFYPADSKFKIYARKTTAARIHFDPFGKFREDPRLPVVDKARWAGSAGPGISEVLKEGDRLLLSNFAPATVLIDENLEVLQLRGKVNSYFELSPGQASLNLLRIAREGLLVELRAAITKAKKDKVVVSKEGLRIRDANGLKTFNLKVVPFQPNRSSETFYLVLFDDSPHPVSKKRVREAKTLQRSEQASEIALLRGELNATKDYLQSVIEEQELINEELKAANEEILSSNEELQSTNEELETTKEELQSANEELMTLNEELRTRNDELNALSSDVANLQTSFDIPIVILGTDLRIRRFTPHAGSMLNLLISDIGRSITDISLGLKFENLQEEITGCIQEVKSRQFDVQHKNGRWYRLQISPYKTSDNRIDGAFMVLLEIDDVRKKSQELGRAVSLYEEMMHLVDQPVVVVDHEMKIKQANRYFYKEFGLQPAQVENRRLSDLPNGWSSVKVRKILRNPLPVSRSLNNVKLELKTGRKNKLFKLNARHVTVENERVIVFTLEDI